MIKQLRFPVLLDGEQVLGRTPTLGAHAMCTSEIRRGGMKFARMQDHFAELTDARRREVTYPLINVVMIARLRSDLWSG